MSGLKDLRYTTKMADVPAPDIVGWKLRLQVITKQVGPSDI
jgi:hypothetical protein